MLPEERSAYTKIQLQSSMRSVTAVSVDSDHCSNIKAKPCFINVLSPLLQSCNLLGDQTCLDSHPGHWNTGHLNTSVTNRFRSNT